ncbi:MULTISPECIES: DUF1127 domain-containing protein [Thalassospira]|jgi:uncharacterized protein YjiS (DUF1127 family)|uniref:DUF1127 domain-containing protein n=1 Tax=Thalassospira lohafexi TaxID=744227 RepID=A0A2N3L106_9PROT|nr:MULTISPECIES: hypothetical protein [Thalassospira]MBV16420.1 hypothetical protein [Thalassospira sp.]PKR56492.1 hypothetical protein COO92_20635 [Thalassospira lohafexi]RCK28897.1 hypothetical protein TH1_07160 [Thalassospira lucentensis MCCC 1A00383 = DSM 14000]|tara:strand:- start:404 stop:613 length:210 start_codon:yes stop_codon:yes gene_type:complete
MVAITKDAGAFVTTRRPNTTITLMDMPRQWVKRYDLRQKLAVMDSRMLRDIGWNVFDARREAAKPFWKA